MDAFIGEIRLLAIAQFTPQGWLLCNGTVYNAQTYQALYSIIGNSYGGTPPSTFAVPDLRGRAAVGIGQNPSDSFAPVFAQNGGSATVTLSQAQMPVHTHNINIANAPPAQRLAAPGNNWIGGLEYLPAATPPFTAVDAFNSGGSPNVALNGGTLSIYPGTGGAHQNEQPFLTLQYCINYDGVYPTRPS